MVLLDPAYVKQELYAPDRCVLYFLDCDSGLETLDSLLYRVDIISKAHVFELIFPIIVNEIFLKTDVEYLWVDNLLKWIRPVSFKEALTSSDPIAEACVPVAVGVLLNPIVITQIASLELILEV